jgi:hypothetical protein
MLALAQGAETGLAFYEPSRAQGLAIETQFAVLLHAGAAAGEWPKGACDTKM